MTNIQIIGHRGAQGLAPENTATSLQKALAHRVDGIEVDVRVTKDGIPILHHNKKLRAPFPKLYVRRQRLVHLQEQCPSLVTLTEAIRLVDRRVPLLLEIKMGEQIGPIAAVVSSFLEQGWLPTDFRVASFSWRALCEIQRRLPQVPLIVSERWSAVRATSRARRIGTKRIIMQKRWLWPGLIRMLHHQKYELIAYTMNDPKRVKQFARAGLSGAITDYPDRFTQ